MHGNETNWTVWESRGAHLVSSLGSANGSYCHWISQGKNSGIISLQSRFLLLHLNIYETKNNELEALETLRQNIFSLDNPVWCNVQVIDSFKVGPYKMMIR